MSNPYQVQGQVPYIQMQQSPGFGFQPQMAPPILPPPSLVPTYNQPPYMYTQPEQMPQYSNDIHPDEVLKKQLEEKWKNKKKGKDRGEKNALVQKEMREHLEKCNHKDCRNVFPEWDCNLEFGHNINDVKIPVSYRIGYKKWWYNKRPTVCCLLCPPVVGALIWPWRRYKRSKCIEAKFWNKKSLSIQRKYFEKAECNCLAPRK